MREVEEIHAPTRTLIFLRRENPLVVNEALEAGADGVMFISSIGSHRGDFFKALQRTRDGSVYYPDAIRAMAREFIRAGTGGAAIAAAGQTNREISDKLFVSAETVKSHVSAVIGKLGVRDRTQAAIFAIGMEGI